MTTKASAKKVLLESVAAILDRDDELFPDEAGDGGPEYERWDTARRELVAEFERRALPSSSDPPAHEVKEKP